MVRSESNGGGAYTSSDPETLVLVYIIDRLDVDEYAEHTRLGLLVRIHA